MSKRIIILFFVALLALTGCVPGLTFSVTTVIGSGNAISENRTVSGFSQITLDGQGIVTVVIGDTESLVIEAEDNLMKYLQSKVNGSELVLSTAPGVNIMPTKPINYTVTVKSLDGLSINGSGNITADLIQASSFRIEIQGSGNVQVDHLITQQLNAQIPGSGTIKVSGKVTTQTASISGSGNYQASDLQSQSSDVTISGSGSAIVWATDSLNAKISGSGTISYYDATQVNQSITGSGQVKNLGKHS